ncbi:hypothetical protein F7734_52945 [Scytonema sp. UIC 10036]|uniref:hypothetical protein n=1 Tax=Scytonema sp. UIC 10036 TaxID=2304196 RepID=UPI0012DA9B55|nr:hypothetical protein [Scytonema sp. UIC 10036]MUH00524.1 hypothetical protein [Scytonema sp. UIC 10036]
MQTFLAIFNKAVRQSIVVLGLMLLISVSSLFFFTQQPSYAVTSRANQLTPEEKIDRAYEYSEATGLREEDRQKAYEQAVKDSNNPQTVEKTYQRNLKAEAQDNPNSNILEQAKELVDRVTTK